MISARLQIREPIRKSRPGARCGLCGRDQRARDHACWASAQRQGWIGHLPAGLDVVGNWWIIAVAIAIYSVEFLVTLVPGVASIWETIQTAVRPIAAAVLAAATVYDLDPG
jgi:hypothetical protein